MRIHKKPLDSRCISLSSFASPLDNHATTSTLPQSNLRHRGRPLLLLPCRLDLSTPEYGQGSRFFYRLEGV